MVEWLGLCAFTAKGTGSIPSQGNKTLWAIWCGAFKTQTQHTHTLATYVKSQLAGKDIDAGKDRSGGEGATEDEMVGWHHRLNGHEFEQALGDSEGQGSLVSCSPWGRKESDTTERLDNNNT